MIVVAPVLVIATVIVVALGNGNDSVVVMDAVDEGARLPRGCADLADQLRGRSSAAILTTLTDSQAATASITATLSFPFPSAATATGAATTTACDHDHDAARPW